MSCGMVCLECNAIACHAGWFASRVTRPHIMRADLTHGNVITCHAGWFASHAMQLHAIRAGLLRTQCDCMSCGQISLARNAITCNACRFASRTALPLVMLQFSLNCATLLTKAYGLDAPSKCRHGCTGSEWRAACHMLKPARALEARVRITPHGAPLSRSIRLARAPDCKARQRPPLRRTAIPCRIEPGCIQERMT